MLPARDDYQLHQHSIREAHEQALRSQYAQATFLEMQRTLPGSSLSEYGSPIEVAFSLQKGGPDIRDPLTLELAELARQANAIAGASLARDLLCLGYWHDLCDLQVGRKVEGPGELCSEVYVVFLERVRDPAVRYDTAAKLMVDVCRTLESSARDQRRKRGPLPRKDVEAVSADRPAGGKGKQREVRFATDIVAALPRLREDLEELFGANDGRFFFRAHLLRRADVAALEGMTRTAVSKKVHRLRGVMNDHLVAQNEAIILFTEKKPKRRVVLEDDDE